MSRHEKFCLLLAFASGTVACFALAGEAYGVAALWAVYVAIWLGASRIARDLARTRKEVMEMRRRPRGF